MLLGPHNFTSSIIWLEKRADLALPRLVVKSVRARIVDEDIDNFLNTMKDVCGARGLDGPREFCVIQKIITKINKLA